MSDTYKGWPSMLKDNGTSTPKSTGKNYSMLCYAMLSHFSRVRLCGPRLLPSRDPENLRLSPLPSHHHPHLQLQAAYLASLAAASFRGH